MRRLVISTLFAAACAGALHAPLPAQDAAALRIPALGGAVRVDGRIDEPAWREVQPLPLVSYLPVAGRAPSERTEIRLAHDGESLYAAGMMYDAEPAGIRANSLYRDRWSGDDTFELLIDPQHDHRNALKFLVTPAGTQIDHAVSGDGEGWDALNVSWNAVWDAAVTRTPEGWFVELRVPLSLLRLQVERGEAVVGITAFRYIARRAEVVAFPALPAERSQANFRPSLAQDARLEGIRPARPLQLTPYLLTGAATSSAPDAAGTAYEQSTARTREVGLDAKLGLGRTLTLDVTANTDFAQAEADDEQINLTRYSLFVPERRSFFLERAGSFDFSTGGHTGVFYSRRIGLSAGGEVRRILGGARLSGRAGAWEAGLLSLQVEAEEGAGSEHASVLRLRRPVLNPFSYAGAILTSRVDGDSANLVAGVDGSLRVGAHEYLTLSWAANLGERLLSAPLAPSHLRLRAERRTAQGLGYDVQLMRAGAAYDPALGFVEARNFSRGEASARYSWLFGEGALRRLQLLGWGSATLRNRDGSAEARRAVTSLEVTSRGEYHGWLALQASEDDLEWPIGFAPGVEVPAGRHGWLHLSTGVGTPEGGRVRAEVGVEAGGFFDGRRTSLSFTPTWVASTHLELGGRYEVNRLSFAERQQALTAHVAQLRVGAALDHRTSLTALLQYNSVRAGASANLRLRYRLREGRELYAVYNEGLNTERDAAEPRLPLRASRQLLIKYTHLWTR